MATTDTPGPPGTRSPQAPEAPAARRTTAPVGEAPAGEEYSREEVTGYERSPRDVLRVGVLTVAALLLLLVARWARGEAAALDDDLVRRVSSAAPTIERVLSGAATLLAAA
jgi:hypothetical protein